MIASTPLLQRAPRGTGHPVLVLPGLAASDISTRPLRAYLRGQGHHVHGWKQGRNVGPTPEVLQGVALRLREVYDRSGGRQVSIVGWSLGGVYALALAYAAPGMVRRVIALGSPLSILDEPIADRPALFGTVTSVLGSAEAPMPPLTSIWSRTDGVVPWRTSTAADRRERRPGLREDIEVVASHLGIGVNPAALYAVADRLALPGQTLPPFQPNRAARALYPRPDRRTASA